MTRTTHPRPPYRIGERILAERPDGTGLMHANVTGIEPRDDLTHPWTITYAQPQSRDVSTVHVDDQGRDADDQVAPLPIPSPEHTIVVAFDVHAPDRAAASQVIARMLADGGACDVLAADPAVDAWWLPEPAAGILDLIDRQTLAAPAVDTAAGSTDPGNRPGQACDLLGGWRD